MNFLTNLNLNKNELQNAVVHPLTVAPSTAKEGQIYYNSADKKLYQYNGTGWKPVGVVYSQANSDTAVITGLNANGSVNVTNVVSLKLGGYKPVDGGYVANNQTLQEAFNALDTAVKNAIAGGGEVNQNAFSNISSTEQSTNFETPVTGNVDSVTISASTKTDTFNFNSGDKWSVVKADSASKTLTIGHGFSGVTDGSYGDENNIPSITVDKAGHITNIKNKNNPGLKYITGLTSNAQTQLNNKINSSEKGTPNGVATLGGDGLVPSNQLPSYVDDVIEAYIVGDTPLHSNWLSASQSGEPLTPEAGKIYVIMTQGAYQNKQYRWGGSVYVLCNPSDVNSVNGKTGIVVLTQDNIGAGSTYTQFAIADKNKLDTIASNATSNTITLNGSKNANPTFYAPISGGTQNQILVSNGSNQEPTWKNAPESFHKYTAQNEQLTASGGYWTWTIPSSVHKITNSGMLVQLYEVASGNLVITDVSINQSNYTITIIVNDTSSVGTLKAGTYKVVVIG